MKNILRASCFALGMAVALPAFASSAAGVPSVAAPFGPNCFKMTVGGIKYAIQMNTFASVAQALFVRDQFTSGGVVNVVGIGQPAEMCVDTDGGFHEAVWYVY
jgi:hypothetical protein